MPTNHWADNPNPDKAAASFGWRIIVIVLVILAVIAGISWLALGFNTATSDVRGRAQAVQTKNAAPNRIAAQERFEDRYQDILASDRRLDVLADAAKADPTDRVARTNLTGATTYCIAAVAAYNADARKYTRAQFRALDLPDVIDDNDTTTDCSPKGTR